jgi:hypothetical protein
MRPLRRWVEPRDASIVPVKRPYATAGISPAEADEIARIEAIADPLERYALATEAQARHEAAARRLGEVRALAALRIHELGASYATIAHVTGLSRARAQQLVEAGRRLRVGRIVIHRSSRARGASSPWQALQPSRLHVRVNAARRTILAALDPGRPLR